MKLLQACIGATLLATAALTVPAAAQDATNTFVRIAPHVPGVLYRPAEGAAHRDTVVVVMHDNNDFLDHPATRNLTRDGYSVLAANASYSPDTDDHDIDWNVALKDLGSTMAYARKIPGVKQVVLLGHSSGAPLAAAYENIAENGVSVCQDAQKIVPCPSSLQGLPRADLVVLLDPIFGLAANFLTSVDPALMKGVRPEDYDVLDPANGFAPTGAHYSDAFRAKFLKAEALRNQLLVDTARARLLAIQSGTSRYADDEPFIVPGASRTPRLWRPDLNLLQHTKEPHLLLKGDGTTVNEIVHTVRVPSGTTRGVADRNDRDAGTPAQAAATAQGAMVKPLLNGGSVETSVKRFLTDFATRSTPDYDIKPDDITGIEWNSSYTSTPGNLEGVKAPILIMGMTGHYWIVSAEIAWRHAASADKSLAYVEGATHGFTPCKPCEKTPGEFGDTERRTFDYVAQWLGTHDQLAK
jgi:pimeloyl-ACP methyl ester carboxylesterase